MSVLYDDVRMDNKQPWIQQFWNACCHYEDIYHWISPLNKWSGSPLSQHSSLWGEIQSLVYFHVFEAPLVMVVLKRKFSGLHFYTLSDIDSSLI